MSEKNRFLLAPRPEPVWLRVTKAFTRENYSRPTERAAAFHSAVSARVQRMTIDQLVDLIVDLSHRSDDLERRCEWFMPSDG